MRKWINSITSEQVHFVYEAVGGFIIVTLFLSIPLFLFLGIWVHYLWFGTAGKAFVSLLVYMTMTLIIDKFIEHFNKED